MTAGAARARSLVGRGPIVALQRCAMLLAASLVPALVPALVARGQTQVLIVSGLGGDPVYSARFAKLSRELGDALVQRVGIPASSVVRLGEDSVRAEPMYAGRSTKGNIEGQFARIAASARPGSQVVIVLLGHGAGEGADSRLSIPGPDLTAADFARLLARLSAQRVAFLDLTSASGDMLPVLSAPNRVVITATRSAIERNESQFATWFVQAFSKDGADTDKDDRVSLLEAFRYAVAETRRAYEADSRILTEHAQLDDNGDRTGTGEPNGRTGDGLVARRFFLDMGALAARGGAVDARLPALYGEKFTLEEAVEAHKLRKPQLAAEAYGSELERLLIALARKAHEIRAIEGRAIEGRK